MDAISMGNHYLWRAIERVRFPQEPHPAFLQGICRRTIRMEAAIGWSTRDRCLLGAAGAVLLVLYLFFSSGEPRDDVLVFYDYAMRFRDGGVPYADFNDFYPPLAWAFILLPGLLATDLQTYFRVYAGIATIAMFLTLAVIMRICRRQGIRTDAAVLAYMVVTVLYYNHAIRKFDIEAVLFLALSIMFFLERRYGLAYPMAVVGGMIKLFPLVAVPVFLIMAVRDPSSRRGTARGLMCSVVLAAAVFVPLMLTFGPSEVTIFLGGNSGRGFQSESVTATVSELVCGLLGIGSERVPAYGTTDVVNPICNALSGPWMLVMAVLMVASLLLVWRRSDDRPGSEEDRTRFLAASLFLAMSVFILSNKVFSTQYIQWLYPMIPLLLAYRGPGDYAYGLSVFAAVVFLSWLGPTFVPDARILMVRDLLMIYLAVHFARYLCGGDWSMMPRSLASWSARRAGAGPDSECR